MAPFHAALWAEQTKFRHSLLPLLATTVMAVGVPVLAVLNLASDPALPGLTEATWTDYLATASATAGTAGLLGFGLVVAWMFGREFADGTITGLFAIPTSRSTIASAKLLLFLTWATITGVAMTTALTAIGTFLDLGAFDPEAIARHLVVTIGTALIVLPCALIATLSRGYFAPIGTIVGIGVLARIAISTPLDAWFPFAAPVTWAAIRAPLGDPAMLAQIGLVALTGAAFAALAIRAWQRLQVD